MPPPPLTPTPAHQPAADRTAGSASDRDEPTPLDALPTDVRPAVERLRRVNPKADPTRVLPDVDPARIPRHVAVIMDGNGRWATARGLARSVGHRVGAGSVRTLIKEAGRLGIEYLTLYSFSTENWKRPADEISELMRLYVDYLAGERDMLSEHNIRLRQIGRRDGLPAECLRALDATLDATAGNTGPTLTLAVNYSGRAEITDAVRAIARQAAAGEIDPADIDERTVERHLYTAGIPDPDLLVRTAGELRVSNYLLWQISYTELFVTETLWPDFQQTDLHAAVRAYAKRSRRFGATEASDATV